jgi:alanyl-tRNA synthetase
MLTTNDIRSTFLSYFERNGHRIVPSSPLVPRNDPSLLFTNAGMVQFKNVFTGVEKRDYARAVTSQKCVRAGGKHNDLENVGYTARHHTFFEMLGNFSFGDYFKEQAIELAWHLITREYGLDPERLLVTVYHTDEEAFGLWKRIAGLSDDRIIRISTNDNFWMMGDTGPCGPCSEIFYDHGPSIPGGPPGSPGEDGDRFIEIWNLVFMQYEQVAGGERLDLPRPSIDTGMGLERLTAVLQGVHDNYDIDLFQALINASADASGVAASGSALVSHRVIADHLRASSFLLADGVLPSNEGRGYVLRRIMRRAMRHAHMIGCRDPLLYRLVPALVQQMGLAFPELAQSQKLIGETLYLEETRFKQTLERGLKLLDDETRKLAQGATLPGSVAFTLYDTFGFPLDLTQDVLRGEGRAVDLAGFESAMAEQRQRARAAWSGSGEAQTETIWFDLKERFGATEFLGYATLQAEGKIVALVVEGQPVEQVAAGQDVSVIVNQTPFYGESGGQQGDAGIAEGAGGRLVVRDTAKKLGAVFVHQGVVEAGTLKVGDVVTLSVDAERRDRLRANHSATHLLHEALRRQLGPHVTQKGSLVAPDRLRFDISHNKPVAPDEQKAVEEEVNRRIRLNGEVTTRLMTPQEAVAAGALALFGEKYGDEVRVLAMGGDGEERYSVELCGGTHVARTGDIGLFKLVGESGVAAGIRRIDALTGAAALAYVTDEEGTLNELASQLRAPVTELPGRVATLLEDKRRLERELLEARKALASAPSGGNGPAVKTIAGVQFAGRQVEGVAPRELKGLVDQIKQQIGSGIVAIAGSDDGKASLVIGVTDDLLARFSAVDLVRIGAEALGGKGGGGRPDLAQAGGPDGALAGAALAAVEAALVEAA